MKKKQNGMYGLLAVIALMLVITIYASCSSEDDDYDNGWVELGTMSKSTRSAGGEYYYYDDEPRWVDSSITSCIMAWDTTVLYKVLDTFYQVEDDSLYAAVRYHWYDNVWHLVIPKYEIEIVNIAEIDDQGERKCKYEVINHHIINLGFCNEYLKGWLHIEYNYPKKIYNQIQTMHVVKNIPIEENISHLLYQDTTRYPGPHYTPEND